MIETNIRKVLERIEKSCQHSGRKREGIQLVVVTKTVPADRILEALRCGARHIGENRVQEAQDKFEALQIFSPTPTRHMIGQLQRNKANRAVEIFDVIQSLDSERLAAVIDRKAGELGKRQNCLVEVKVSEEAAKTGVLPQDLEKLLDKCSVLKNLRIQGLMCVAPYFEDPENARPYFAKARSLFECFFSGPQGGVLSMGMSHDFEAAIQEGSNMIRVGTAIFGERSATRVQ